MSLPSNRDRPRTTGKRGDWDITAEAPAKKPKAPPKARSALKSTKRLERGKPIERGDSELKRTGGPAPVSAKKAARRGERDAVRKTECAMKHLGGCSGPVDTHEIVRASQMAEARYMNSVTVGACRKHHDWDVHRLFSEWAGLRIPRWAYDLDPEGTVQEAAVRRTNPRVGFPSWWSEDNLRDWHANLGHYPTLTAR